MNFYELQLGFLEFQFSYLVQNRGNYLNAQIPNDSVQAPISCLISLRLHL